MPSFDIVSKVPWNEVENATQQAQREIQTRFDFKGTSSEIERTKEGFTITANSEARVGVTLDVLKDKLVRRKVSLKHLDAGKVEAAGRQMSRQHITVKEGIDSEHAKKLVAMIKAEKSLKVQASILEDTVRVTGKKRDDLQAAIQMIKGQDLDIEVSFTNFRE